MSPIALGFVGVRRDFMTIGPGHRAVRSADACFDVGFVHTPSACDDETSDRFFRPVGLPEPVVHPGVEIASHSAQIARIPSNRWRSARTPTPWSSPVT